VVGKKEKNNNGSLKEEETNSLKPIYYHNDGHYDTKMEIFNLDDEERDKYVRSCLKYDDGANRESGVPLSQIPEHLAVIMDGNRRYGRAKYGSATRGHWDGSKTLVEFAKWCIVEGVQVLTVYAFSTENWSRHPSEVQALMAIFCKYCDELRIEALKKGIRLNFLSTDTKKVNNLLIFLCLNYVSAHILSPCSFISSPLP